MQMSSRIRSRYGIALTLGLCLMLLSGLSGPAFSSSPYKSPVLKKPPVPPVDSKPSLQETINWLYEKLNTATNRPVLYSDAKTVLYPRVRHDHGLSYLLRSYSILPTQDLCHLNFTPKIDASTRYSGTNVNFQSMTRSFGVIPLDLAKLSARISQGDLVIDLPPKSTFTTQVYATSCTGDCQYWKNMQDRVFTHNIAHIRLGTQLENPNQFLNTLDQAKSLCKPSHQDNPRLTQ